MKTTLIYFIFVASVAVLACSSAFSLAEERPTIVLIIVDDRAVREPALVMEFLPTLMDIAGATYPNGLNGNTILATEGQSLRRVLKGWARPERTFGFDHQAAHAIHQGDWKTIYGKRMQPELKWEVYILAEERCAMDDLFRQHQERLKRMTAGWDMWGHQVGVIWGHQPPLGKSNTSSPNQPHSIMVTSESAKSNGIAIAQRRTQNGYALHFVNGKPAFGVHIDGKVARAVWDESVVGKIQLNSKLYEKSMSHLARDKTSSIQSRGLMATQPSDGLSIGKDSRTTTGRDQASNRIKAKILSHYIKARKYPVLNR